MASSTFKDLHERETQLLASVLLLSGGELGYA